MAPLKLFGAAVTITTGLLYPWLRGHGSIEVASIVGNDVTLAEYPWLRGHGSIEVCPRTPASAPAPPYPWLRGHGSIEVGR